MAEQFPYEDIVNMPHHVSKKYPQPTMADRAARFAPFAAITGYEEMVLEEARVTDDRIEMDESSKAALNEKDVYKRQRYDSMLTSFPFYAFIIAHAVEYLVPALIICVAGLICKKKFAKKED